MSSAWHRVVGTSDGSRSDARKQAKTPSGYSAAARPGELQRIARLAGSTRAGDRHEAGGAQPLQPLGELDLATDEGCPRYGKVRVDRSAHGLGLVCERCPGRLGECSSRLKAVGRLFGQRTRHHVVHRRRQLLD